MKKKRFRLAETEKVTKHILEIFPSARNNLGLLVGMVWSYINPSTRGMTYTMVLSNTEKLGLPSYESVSRTRRRLVNKYPELAGTIEVERGRKEEEKEYREYAKGMDKVTS